MLNRMRKTPIELSFEKIYKNNLWGLPNSNRKNTKFFSGIGTNIENDYNSGYRKLLQEWVNKKDVKKVIEIGCGDFEVTGSIDLSSVDYIGYDVVEIIIDYNNKHFKKDNIQFIYTIDIFQNLSLKADLIIIKDVLQHLPINHYLNFIKNIPNNFKYNLITNDYFEKNVDINFADWAGNNFEADPFNMKTNILIDWIQEHKEACHKVTLSLE